MTKFLAFFFFLLVACNKSAMAKCTHGAGEFQCVKYLKNYDGDTITVKVDGVHPIIGNKLPVRINGVDTPELKTKNSCEKTAARWAKKFVASQLKNAKRIDLKNIKRGKYFRVVADVIVDGKDIRDLLIKNKLAVAYDGGTKSKVDWCILAKSPQGRKFQKL